MSDFTTNEMKERAAERAVTRNKLREAYQRIYNNPFRTNSQIFDPAVFRYEAARAYAKEFYKITPRSIAIPLGLLALTVWLQKKLNKNQEIKEAEIRSGQKTYYERARWSSRILY